MSVFLTEAMKRGGGLRTDSAKPARRPFMAPEKKYRRSVFGNKFVPTTEEEKMAYYAQSPQYHYYNEGGSTPAPIPSGAPGAAQAAINTYLTGNASTAPQLSYAPGAVAGKQQAAYEYQRDLRDLNEAGVDNAENYVYQDYTDAHESGDNPWKDQANWTDDMRNRFYETGTTGHLISKDDRPAHMRGVHQLTPEQVAEYMDTRNNAAVMPGMLGMAAGGLGGVMRGKMQEAIDAGGTPVMVNGQMAVLNKDGSVIGNTGELGAQGLRHWGSTGGRELWTPAENPFGNLFSSVTDIITGKKAADEAARREAEAQRQREAAAIMASNQAWNQSDRESDHGNVTTHGGTVIGTSAGSFEKTGTHEKSSRTDGGWGWNTGGPVMEDDDVWGADPLAAPRGTTNFGGQHPGHVQAQVKQMADPYAGVKQAALKQGVGMMFGDPFSGQGIAQAGAGALLGWNEGGSVNKQKMNAGQWVGKRCRYLNDGGMALPEAEMQAYNDMQSLTGPSPVGAEFMMPEDSPMPEEFTPQNNFGYVPSGGKTYKEQMEADKVYIQREKAMQDDDRAERAFDAAERRKDEAHKLSMSQKQEGHQESMRQKKAGPLAGE